jgi:hypothetical protein
MTYFFGKSVGKLALSYITDGNAKRHMIHGVNLAVFMKIMHAFTL